MVNLAALAAAAALALGAGPDGAAAPPPEISLADALAELERENPGLEQARLRADEARAITRQAWAPLLPTLTAQGSYVTYRDEVVFAQPVTDPGTGETRLRRVFIQPGEQLSVTGSARVPLIVPSSWYDVAAAKAGARGSEASAEAAWLSLRAAFTQAAHAARAAEEVVAASEAAVANAEELARSASRRVAAGTAAPLDRLRAETEAVRRASDLAQARANLERSRLALGILLGRERPVRVTVPALGAGEPPDPGALASEALAARPELAAQRAQVDAARAQVRSAWARLAPQLSASGSIFQADVAYPTGEKDGWRASVDLVWPLYDGGARYGKRREAEARLASAGAAEEGQRLAILQEVADAARDLDVARERLRLAESQRRLASDAAGTARRGFEAGVASSLDVIDANDRLYLADVGLAETRARLAGAAVALERAAGR
jgi:outer membrane protein TolC